MQKPLAKKAKKPVRARTTYPGLNFAIAGEMLSDEEIKACQSGDAEVQGHTLFNYNAKLTFPTGTGVSLYPQRRSQLLIDKLLQIDPGDENET